jgi:hypothetical protein
VTRFEDTLRERHCIRPQHRSMTQFVPFVEIDESERDAIARQAVRTCSTYERG